jgi:hypothetical protein
MNIKDRLEKMRGKFFLYNAKNHKIVGYKMNADDVVIATDKEIFVWDYITTENNLSSFLPVENEPVDAIVLFSNGEIKSITSILMDSINKIQQDPGYIKQAMAINSTANTLINAAKMALQLYKQKLD